jgi:hypothetical protein
LVLFPNSQSKINEKDSEITRSIAGPSVVIFRMHFSKPLPINKKRKSNFMPSTPYINKGQRHELYRHSEGIFSVKRYDIEIESETKKKLAIYTLHINA